jgi:glycerol-3-phosphate acyltransferase PlsY
MSGKKRARTAVLDGFKDLDMFSEPINFKFDGGKTFFKTYTGALATVIMALIVLTFTLQRATIMFRYVDANVRSEVVYNYFNENFHFGAD